MKPNARQFQEAQALINQVGVTTEKVVEDVAAVIAERDSYLDDLRELRGLNDVLPSPSFTD